MNYITIPDPGDLELALHTAAVAATRLRFLVGFGALLTLLS